MVPPIFAATTIIGGAVTAGQVIGRGEKLGRNSKGFYGTNSIFRGIDSPGPLVVVPSRNSGRVTIMRHRCLCFQVNDPLHEWGHAYFLYFRFGFSESQSQLNGLRDSCLTSRSGILFVYNDH